MKNNSFLKTISTLGPLGYLPASGTIGSLVGILLVLGCKYLNLSLLDYTIVTVVLTAAVLYCIEQARFLFPACDPAPIILDELVGCFYIFIGVPFTIWTAVTGFLLFRFFDISKLGGIKHCEKLSGAAGIVADDLVAGLCANVCLRILLFFVAAH